MSQLYTNLPLSRKIASLGVECESEKWHYSIAGTKEGCFYDMIGAEDSIIRHGRYQEKICRAYSLGELPPVLQAIGAVKGWGKHIKHRGGYTEVTWDWQDHFLEIARLYLDSPEKAHSYLEDLLN